MEEEPCSGSGLVVDKKRKRKRKQNNRNGSDLRMDKENYIPEKSPLVNVSISLPSPADCSSALENSKDRPCNELDPFPAKRKKKKHKRKKQEISTTKGDTSAEVPYPVLQANELDVKDNITCSSGNFHQLLEHEKIQPTDEINCLTMKQKRKKKQRLRKRKRKEAKAKENVSENRNTLTEVPNNVSQIAELDENIPKEFSLTCGKQGDIEKNLYSLEKEDVQEEACTLLSDFSNLNTSSKKKKVKRVKKDRRGKPSSGIVDFSDHVQKESSLNSDEAHVSHLSDSKAEQVEKRVQVTLARASIAEASVCDTEQRLDLPERPESKKKKVKRVKKDRRGKPSSGIVDFSDHVQKESSLNSDEAHVSHLSDSKAEQVEKKVQVTLARASIAEASVRDTEQRLDLPERPETFKLHSAENGSAEVFLVESTAMTEAIGIKNVEKLFHLQIVEEHVSRVDKEIGAASNCNGEASVDSGLVSCCEHSNGNGVKVNRQIDEVNPSSGLLLSEGDTKLDININKGSMHLQTRDILSERTIVEPSTKKLLILDLNGLLADIIPYVGCGCKPDLIVSRKAVFKRPFVDDFLQFCFEKFAVGVWSSRTKRNVDPVVDFLMGDSKGKLLFCWDQSHCTITKFTTVENRDKPLVLKELKKLWDKLEPDLPWEKGAYDESNTLLLDDSPYKALRNPANTGIFPYSYHYRDANDNSLGPGGDLRIYLESLALADDVRKYVEQNPFGQRAITNSNPSWNYYKRVLAADLADAAAATSK